jgi:hypothetical protein
LHIAAALYPDQIRIAARQVKKKHELEVEPDDFLNSFFLRDLERLAVEAAQFNLNGSLCAYLTSDDEANKSHRSDVRTSLDDLWQNTAPQLVPVGRWPAAATQPLYFSQQFAVNSALDEFRAGSAIFGVNGPPGTGKTTLLRELIVSNIVDRAHVLARLPRPELAFSGDSGQWQSGKYRRTIYLWRQDLLGFGIVVASSNNRAVENVTLEIPAKHAVAEEYLSEIDHFGDFATRILKPGSTKAMHQEPVLAWGLIAAKLGNRKNRRSFVSRFWFEDKEAPEPKSRSQKGFLRYLKALEPDPSIWKKAVGDFEDAIKEEGEIRQVRVAAWEAVERRTRLAATLAATYDELRTAEAAISEAKKQIAALDDAETACNAALREAVESRSRHQEFKPSLVDAVFTRGAAYREWRDRDLALASLIEQEETKRRFIREGGAGQEAQLAGVQQRIQKLTADLLSQQAQVNEHDEQLRRLCEQLSPAFPSPDRWLAEPKERELCSPWADPTWNRARTKVVIQALRLHRALIHCVPDEIRSNLSGAIDILSGKVSTDLAAGLLEATWATLFFVIPVISTTFASFDRLFAHAGRDSIGLLLIDEAGQAVPQAAAGALWRSKKAIAVGDPRQLEPIVTLPFTAQQALRRHFGVEETWLPSKNSPQTLADRVSRFGTWLHSENSDQNVWVGSPLRVHRRCEVPMFDISNQIAYDRQMVYDTQESPCSLPPSCWIDVRSAESEDHWIPAEGRALKTLLGQLFRLGATPDEILLLSPFRAVARKLREISQQQGIGCSGTIHVSQGKEAEVVILVLGGNPRRQGAKEWASEKPNLLNVAVSRAKRRLYIVGNREEWSQYPYFADAAALMERKESPERKAAAR